MHLDLAEMIQLFSGVHRIAREKDAAFRARFKHLQRLGFPPGANVGTGKRAEYGADKLFLVGIALELLQLGLSPERAVKLITDDLHPIACAGRFALRDLHLHANSREKDGNKANWSQWYLRFDPHNLATALGSPSDPDQAEASFWYCGSHEIRRWFDNESSEESLSGWPRISLINVSTLLLYMHSSLHDLDEYRAVKFVVDLEDWLNSFPEETAA